jgi:hypothetical protein
LTGLSQCVFTNGTLSFPSCNFVLLFFVWDNTLKLETLENMLYYFFFFFCSKKNYTLNNMANRITTMAANIAESCLNTIIKIEINSYLVNDYSFCRTKKNFRQYENRWVKTNLQQKRILSFKVIQVNIISFWFTNVSYQISDTSNNDTQSNICKMRLTAYSNYGELKHEQ